MKRKQKFRKLKPMRQKDGRATFKGNTVNEQLKRFQENSATKESTFYFRTGFKVYKLKQCEKFNSLGKTK